MNTGAMKSGETSAAVITALAADVPPAVTLSQWYEIEARLRATEPAGWDRLVYPSWLAAYGLDPGQISDAPGGALTSPADVTPDACLVPVEHERDLSALAADVAQAICVARGPNAPPVGVAMFCHGSLNEHVSTTTAGRLRAVIGTPCFPFSVSQQQGASAFTALRLATDLLVAEPELHALLIVAADKWRHPFSRRTPQGALQGDAAGALLVERASPAMRGLRLLGAAARMLPQTGVPFEPSLSRIGTETVFTPALLALIDSLLQRHDLCRNEVTAVVAQHISQPLADAVFRHLDLAQNHPVTGARAYLGAAESIVRLTEALAAPELPHGSIVLAWGIGLGGYVGCALLETHGTPHLCAADDAQRPS